MYWNHRVIFHSETNPEDSYYAIHECYYGVQYEDPSDESHYDGVLLPNGWTQRPVSILSDNIEEMRKTLNFMLTATHRPLLTEKGGKLVEYKPE